MRPSSACRLLTAVLPFLPLVGLAAEPAGNEDFDFAESLFAERDYGRAVAFYKRAAFLSRDSRLKARANYRAGQCLQMEKQVNPAIAHFLKATNDPALRQRALYQIGHTKYLARAYGAAVRDLDHFRSAYPESEWAPRALALSARACIQEYRWQDAADRYSLLLESYPGSPYASNAPALRELALKGLRLPRKLPWLSGLMSAIVPGSGQVYCDRYVDGGIAFFLNAAFFGLTWISWENERIRDWAPWVSGTFFGVFYAANIYGAVNAAQNGDEIIRHNHREAVLRRYPGPQPLDLGPLP